MVDIAQFGRALNCGFSGYGFKSCCLPYILDFKINIISNLALKKKIKKNYNILISNKIKLLKFNTMFFYSFLYNYINIKNYINYYKNYLNINNIILLNLNNKQAKINLLDLDIKKKYIFTIGLVLKILNIYKKSSRRSIQMLKYLINFLIKKYLITWSNKKFMFVIKGLKKNFIKIVYFFKFIIYKFNIKFFYINPTKFFKITKIKKIRSIKRRVYKKLITLNKI